MRNSSAYEVLGIVLLIQLCACTDESISLYENQDSFSSEGSLTPPQFIHSPEAGSFDQVNHFELDPVQPAVLNEIELVEAIAKLGGETGYSAEPEVLALVSQLEHLNPDTLARAIRDVLLSKHQEYSISQNLRNEFLQLLLGLDSHQVEGIAFELLSSNPAPEEICLVGNFLYGIQPDIYREYIRKAGEPFIQDPGLAELPGEFFQLMGAVGDASTTAILMNLPPHLSAYSSIALAQIRDGSGILLLQADAKLFDEGINTAQGRLAVKLLAQEAYRQEEAAQAIFELAKAGLIPQDLWEEVADLFSGRRVITLESPTIGQFDSRTIYRPEGNQHFYTIVRSPFQQSFEEMELRIALLGQIQPLVPEYFQKNFTEIETDLESFREDFFFN